MAVPSPFPKDELRSAALRARRDFARSLAPETRAQLEAQLADRNVGDVVSLLQRRQELRGVYPAADLVADNVGWVV